jgi:hypothetical protein
MRAEFGVLSPEALLARLVQLFGWLKQQVLHPFPACERAEVMA